MCDASISQFNLRLVNQQRQINDCVFRRFDSSTYLTTLRSTPITLRICTLIITYLVNVWRKFSQFNLRLVNQQRQINDCVFRSFDSSTYLTTLRSTISPCRKAVTLILISFYNPSSHLWKPSKKYLGTTAFFSWMPFKICDCDKFLSTIPVTQFWL